MSVAVIAAYLAFFPVAVGMLRGLQSPPAYAVELMRSYAGGVVAARWCSCGCRRRVPYLFPALRLAGAAAVVGAVVGEISTGTRGRHRPADHRVLPGGHLRPGEGLHRDARRGRCSGCWSPALVALLEPRAGAATSRPEARS